MGRGVFFYRVAARRLTESFPHVKYSNHWFRTTSSGGRKLTPFFPFFISLIMVYLTSPSQKNRENPFLVVPLPLCGCSCFLGGIGAQDGSFKSLSAIISRAFFFSPPSHLRNGAPSALSPSPRMRGGLRGRRMVSQGETVSPLPLDAIAPLHDGDDKAFSHRPRAWTPLLVIKLALFRLPSLPCLFYPTGTSPPPL